VRFPEKRVKIVRQKIKEKADVTMVEPYRLAKKLTHY